MTAFFQSPFLSALGWALANSLWQMALLWLLFQLCFGINKKVSPRLTYLGALVFMLGGFIWFGITFAQQYAASASISQYLANLPAVDDTATATTSNTGTFNFSTLLSIGEKYLPYLSASYLIILVMLFVRLINAYGYSQEVKTRGLIKIDYNWRVFVKDFANRIGIRREVAIYLSELIDVPATMGWLKPVILLPVATFTHLSPAQVEAVILHELSHIKRNDYLVNLLISVVETILFFNPFCQLLASTIRKERENCCDDFVIQLRCDPGSYAAALLSLEKMRVSTQQQLAIAATGNKNQLVGRVKRILNVKSRNFNYGQKITALMLTAFILSSLAWLSPDEKSKPSKEITQQVVAQPGMAAAANSPLAFANRDLVRQNIMKRKMATLMPKNKFNLAPVDQELNQVDWNHMISGDPGLFSYRTIDSFAGFQKDFFKRDEFKMKRQDWNPDNFFAQPNPAQEALAEADRSKLESRHHVEVPYVYFNLPQGNYDVQKPYSDSAFSKEYKLSQDFYWNQNWNQNWNLPLIELQSKLSALGMETEKLSRDQEDVLREIIRIKTEQNGSDDELILAPSAENMKTFQNDSANTRHPYQFNYNMTNRKQSQMAAGEKQRTKIIVDQKAMEAERQMSMMQAQAMKDLLNIKTKEAVEESQRIADKIRAIHYNQFLQRVNPGHGEYQERQEPANKAFRKSADKTIKDNAENNAQEELQRVYRNQVRSLEDYQRLLEMEQKRSNDRQKQLEEKKEQYQKELEDHGVVVNTNGTQEPTTANGTIVLTSGSSTTMKAMKVVFKINTDCIEPAALNVKPLVLTVQGTQHVTVDSNKEMKTKKLVKLHAIDL